jgi:regulator of protease activity HflC (stomatin/prohibitin superfamily)
MLNKRKMKIATLVIVVLILILESFQLIDSGHTGVVKTLGKINEQQVLSEGFHLKIPFIQSIIEMDNRVKKEESKASAASKDLQNVKTLIAINYKLSND